MREKYLFGKQEIGRTSKSKERKLFLSCVDQIPESAHQGGEKKIGDEIDSGEKDEEPIKISLKK